MVQRQQAAGTLKLQGGPAWRSPLACCQLPKGCMVARYIVAGCSVAPHSERADTNTKIMH